MATGDARRGAAARSGALLTGPLPVTGRTVDVVLRLGAELEAARTALAGPVEDARAGRIDPVLVLGDVADAASRAARAGRGQEARRLLSRALALQVPPSARGPWQQLVGTALEVVDAVAWPEDEPWCVLPGGGPDRGTTPSDPAAPPV